MRWLFMGGGNMASSLIGGLIAAGASGEDIAVVDPEIDTLTRLHEHFGVVSASSLTELCTRDERWVDAQDESLGIVMAVKPHIVHSVCETLAAAPFSGVPALLSVAAGVRCESLSSWLGDNPSWSVMRCMPNTPALIGKGASALYVDRASASQQQAALSMLNAVGTAVVLEHEHEIDAVTALSGSGPAYVFRLTELMIENAVALGLSAEQAVELGIATIEGAAAMLAQGQDSPSQLRENVTSAGGTTAAALEQFTEGGLEACISKGMQAAEQRAQELGDSLATGN